MEGSNNNATKAQEEKKAVVSQSNGVEAPATKQPATQNGLVNEDSKTLATEASMCSTLPTQASVMATEESKDMGAGLLGAAASFNESSTNFYKRDQASNNLDLDEVEDNEAEEVGGKKKRRKRNKKKNKGKTATGEESQLSQDQLPSF